MSIKSLILGSRGTRVEAVRDMNPKFRIITLRGDGLKNVICRPGDKIEVELGKSGERTYTPFTWGVASGCTQILVYQHAEGPGTRWARRICPGDACSFVGPRKSIDLTRVRSSALVFGDETSFGLAAALKATATDVNGIEFLFELSTPQESLQALEYFGLRGARHCIWRNGAAYTIELEAKLLGLLAGRRPEHFVLTGRSTAIQKLIQVLRGEGFSSAQFQTKAYWASGKKGLD